MTYVYPTIDQLRNDLHTPTELKNLAKFHSSELDIPKGENAWAFLWALCVQESDGGVVNVSRNEPAYSPGGIYFKKSKTLSFLYEKYGSLVCASYGPWQMLFITAYELGYKEHPAYLWSGFVSLPWVVTYLNKAKAQGANTIELLAASYNGGFGAIKRQNENVQKYVAKVKMNYDNFKSKLI